MSVKCPICLNKFHNGSVKRIDDSSHGGRKYDCPTCGEYIITDEAREDYVETKLNSTLPEAWTKRAALSHILRNGKGLPRFKDTGKPTVSRKELESLFKDGPQLPSYDEQMRRAIKLIGDSERRRGIPLEHNSAGFFADIGAANPLCAVQLLYELAEDGLVRMLPAQLAGHEIGDFISARLTSAGWAYWEGIQKGTVHSEDGFIAMQFGDPRVDKFVRNIIEISVADQLEIKIQRGDSPGKTRSGVIDNIMRDDIASAAFVIVELSHGNQGAYWEAGLAEGLGKPVIYICEKSVWDDPNTKPHFDVNHRTTIMWEENKIEDFKQLLLATIRNSLRDTSKA